MNLDYWITLYDIYSQASDGGFVKRSAASMLSGKRPVPAAVSLNLYSISCFLISYWSSLY